MTKNIISKVESFINNYMGGDMSQKQFIIDTVKEELSEAGASETAKSVGLTYAEENELMFADGFKRKPVLTMLRGVKRQIMAIHRKREEAKAMEFRKLHYTFMGIEFGKVIGKFRSEDDMWDLVDEFESIICDSVQFARNDSGYAGFYLLCNERWLDKIMKAVEGKV